MQAIYYYFIFRNSGQLAAFSKKKMANLDAPKVIRTYGVIKETVECVVSEEHRNEVHGIRNWWGLGEPGYFH